MSADETARRGRGSRGRARDGRTGGRRARQSAQDDAGTARNSGAGAEGSGDTDPEQRARDTVYRLLTARARSRSELMEALLRKGIEEDIANGTLDKFDEAGLIDDASFAESWVRQRHENQGLGRRALGTELRRKGVAEETVADALANVDDDAEFSRARELVRRKLRTMSVTDPTARKRRLVAMLARKGYGEGMAFRAVREELESWDADQEPGLDTP